MDSLLKIIKEINLPFAYHHFAQGESKAPPFLIYLIKRSDNFSADGRVFFKINEVNLEVYTDYKNLEIERKVELVLDKYEIFYEKVETYIESEKLYEVFYSFEMKGEDNE